MSDTHAPAGIGDNMPPPPDSPWVPQTVDEATLVSELAEHNGDLEARFTQLMDAMIRFREKVGGAINDDETLTRAGGFVLQLRDCAKDCDSRRVAAKAPFLAAGAIIDGFFKGGMSDRLNASAAEITRLQSAYQTAKAERERREAAERARLQREREDAERRAAAEAEREKRAAEQARIEAERAASAARNQAERAEAQRQAAEAEAARRQAEDRARAAADAAAQAQQQAREATKIEVAPAAAITRTRGDVALTTTRQVWKYRVIDITKVPAAYLQINDAVVRAAIKGKTGVREIPGLEIYDELEATNRR